MKKLVFTAFLMLISVGVKAQGNPAEQSVSVNYYVEEREIEYY